MVRDASRTGSTTRFANGSGGIVHALSTHVKIWNYGTQDFLTAEDHSNKPCTCKFSRKVGRSEVRMRLVGPPCKYWQRSKTYFLICQSQSLSRFYHLQDLFAIQGFDVARLNFGAPGQFSYADLNHLAGI